MANIPTPDDVIATNDVSLVQLNTNNIGACTNNQTSYSDAFSNYLLITNTNQQPAIPRHVFQNRHIATAVSGNSCMTCGKSFRSKQLLSQHMLVHTDERKYKCDYCDRAFKQLCHRQQHHRIHTGEKPYRCPVQDCRRAFPQLSNLQHHLRHHDLPAPPIANTCHFCDRVYASEAVLRNHVMKIHMTQNQLSPSLGLHSLTTVKQELTASLPQTATTVKHEVSTCLPRVSAKYIETGRPIGSSQSMTLPVNVKTEPLPCKYNDLDYNCNENEFSTETYNEANKRPRNSKNITSMNISVDQMVNSVPPSMMSQIIKREENDTFSANPAFECTTSVVTCSASQYSNMTYASATLTELDCAQYPSTPGKCVVSGRPGIFPHGQRNIGVLPAYGDDSETNSLARNQLIQQSCGYIDFTENVIPPSDRSKGCVAAVPTPHNRIGTQLNVFANIDTSQKYNREQNVQNETKFIKSITPSNKRTCKFIPLETIRNMNYKTTETEVNTTIAVTNVAIQPTQGEATYCDPVFGVRDEGQKASSINWMNRHGNRQQADMITKGAINNTDGIRTDLGLVSGVRADEQEKSCVGRVNYGNINLQHTDTNQAVVDLCVGNAWKNNTNIAAIGGRLENLMENGHKGCNSINGLTDQIDLTTVATRQYSTKQYSTDKQNGVAWNRPSGRSDDRGLVLLPNNSDMQINKKIGNGKGDLNGDIVVPTQKPNEAIKQMISSGDNLARHSDKNWRSKTDANHNDRCLEWIIINSSVEENDKTKYAHSNNDDVITIYDVNANNGYIEVPVNNPSGNAVLVTDCAKYSPENKDDVLLASNTNANEEVIVPPNVLPGSAALSSNITGRNSRKRKSFCPQRITQIQL